MAERAPEPVKKIIPFAPTKDARGDLDPVEQSGQAIVALLQQAAETSNSNCDRAMDLAHKLSMQLRVAEERVRELEGVIRHYQDRAERAERWLVRIYNDIEQKFFEQKVPGTEQSKR